MILSLGLLLMIATEIVKFHGSRLTKPSLMHHLGRDISPNTKLLKEAVGRGEDPDSVILIEGVRSDRAGKGQTIHHNPLCTLHVSFLTFTLALRHLRIRVDAAFRNCYVL
jgi:hypothetical protein